MHLDAAKAVPAVGEANFLMLVCLGLLFSCFFRNRNHAVVRSGFYVLSYLLFSSFFSLIEFSNCSLVCSFSRKYKI